MVREGAGARTLDAALGHIPGTALPWQEGNVGVAGHRDSLFRGLGRIRKTDRIEIQTVNGTYVYEVESTSIVKPQRVSVLDAGPYPEITLVTCYPFHYIGSAPDRFIVKARQISQPQTASAEPKKTEASTVVPVAEQQPAVPVAEQQPTRPPERPLQHPLLLKVYFQLSAGHSRTLVPGVSLGLDRADPTAQRVNGWMWVMPDRKTIWISRERPHEPLVFYGHQDGKRRELVITRIGRNSVSGYLQLFGG
jgi:sortase A